MSLSKKDMKSTLIEILGRKVRISSINRDLYEKISQKTKKVWALRSKCKDLIMENGSYGISLKGMCHDAMQKHNAEALELHKLIKENAKYLTFHKNEKL